MRQLLLAIWSIALLRESPLILPDSPFLARLLLGLHLIVGFGLGVWNTPGLQALAYAAISTLVLIFMVQVLVAACHASRQLNRALAALAGCEVILNFAALPLVLLTPERAAAPLAQLAAWILLIWSVFVAAHVFRHTLGITKGAGMLFALSYAMLSLILSGLLVEVKE